MSRIYWVYLGMKNLTSLVNNDHQNNGWPWPTPAEMAPQCPTAGLAPCVVVLSWWAMSLWASRYKCGGLRGYSPQNTPMLRWCIIAGTKEHIEGKHPLNPPQIISTCLGGCCPSVQHVLAGLDASFRVLGGHFRRRQPWLWWSLCVVWSMPEHKQHLSSGTTVYLVLLKSSCLEQDNYCIVLMLRQRDEREKVRNGKQTSSPYVGMLII